MSEIVDEGLGDEFDDTPWVPPTLKRVSRMLVYSLGLIYLSSFTFDLKMLTVHRFPLFLRSFLATC